MRTPVSPPVNLAFAFPDSPLVASQHQVPASPFPDVEGVVREDLVTAPSPLRRRLRLGAGCEDTFEDRCVSPCADAPMVAPISVDETESEVESSQGSAHVCSDSGLPVSCAGVPEFAVASIVLVDDSGAASGSCDSCVDAPSGSLSIASPPTDCGDIFGSDMDSDSDQLPLVVHEATAPGQVFMSLEEATLRYVTSLDSRPTDRESSDGRSDDEDDVSDDPDFPLGSLAAESAAAAQIVPGYEGLDSGDDSDRSSDFVQSSVTAVR